MGRKKLGDKKKMNLCIRITPEDYCALVEAEKKTGLSTTKVVVLCLQTENNIYYLGEYGKK